MSGANYIARMEQATSDNTWTWAKQLPYTFEVLESMTMRPDNQRIALFHTSNLLLIINTVDGSIVKAHTVTSGTPFFECGSNPCHTIYRSNTDFYIFSSTL